MTDRFPHPPLLPRAAPAPALCLAGRYGGSYSPAVGVPVHGTMTMSDGQQIPNAQPLYGSPYYPPYAAQGQPVAGEGAPRKAGEDKAGPAGRPDRSVA